MITRFSWRRSDCPDVDAKTGIQAGAAEHLMATDAGSVTVLHLDPGGATPREEVPTGQLVAIVAGSGSVDVGDESVSVATGDAVRWPARVPHRLSTDGGVSALVFTYEEPPAAWRVSRVRASGRWVAGVFTDTSRARSFRDRLRGRTPDETIALD